MRVFITGIDSFTGSHLLNYLDAEIFGSSLVRSGKQIYRCNILEKERLQTILEEVRPDAIIHLAAISYVAYEKKEDFYRINTIGSTNVIEAGLAAGCERFILASSATVYGNQTPPYDEEMCPRPLDHYGASKVAAEYIARNFFHEATIFITRPFNYTGIGQPSNFIVPKIVDHFCKKKPLELGKLSSRREFNDISFVCEAYRRLLRVDAPSQILNICSGRSISIEEVIKMMEDISGYSIEVTTNPKFIRNNDIENLQGSPQKLFKLIGEIEQKPFEETLKEMYENCR